MIYATPPELARYLDPDATDPEPPPLASVLLRSASDLVTRDIAGARYSVDTEGIPTDPAKLTAVKDASMEQASAWSLHGIDPRKGPTQVARRVASKSVTGVSVTYIADPASDNYLSDLASGLALTASAWRILDNAGLISNRVSTGGGGYEFFNVTQRHFDPLTGALDAE